MGRQENITIKKHAVEIKPIKTREEIRTRYCLCCKDYNHDFRPEEVKMTNKVLREKSSCVVCRSSKSRFLKENHNKK